MTFTRLVKQKMQLKQIVEPNKILFVYIQVIFKECLRVQTSAQIYIIANCTGAAPERIARGVKVKKQGLSPFS